MVHIFLTPVKPPLPRLPSIIICNRCYWSCLGIPRDLRWDLFLPNAIMLINSCFGDLPPPHPPYLSSPSGLQTMSGP